MKHAKTIICFFISISILSAVFGVTTQAMAAQVYSQDDIITQDIYEDIDQFKNEPMSQDEDDIIAQDIYEDTDQLENKFMSLNVDEIAAQDAITVVDNEDDLRIALLQSHSQETIYVTDMNITKEMDFLRDINVTIASATGDPVKLSTSKPALGNYSFNFNGGNVELTFDNVIIDGDGTHVLFRFQNVNEVVRVIRGGVFRNGYRTGNGAALFVENGNITVINCRFENNTAARGAAIYLGNNVRSGGNGDAVIENCIFINNIATDFEGGAISIRNDYNPEKGNLTINNSTFENNHASGTYGSGGAVSGFGDVTVDSSSFVNSSAALGGAISAGGTKCVISGCTFANNRSTASDSLAELYQSYSIPCGGGAIYSSSASIALQNSTFNANESTQDGGAICTSNGAVAVKGGTISGNRADKNGGGIWIAELNLLTTIGAIFENNQAAIGHYWRAHAPVNEGQSADALIHNENIINTSFTAPYTNAYSNHDVNYMTAATASLFTVTYRSNNSDSGAPPIDRNSPYLSGETVTVLTPPDSFVKQRYVFSGWNTEPDGKGINYAYDRNNGLFTSSEFTMDAADIVLYAQWEAVPPSQQSETKKPESEGAKENENQPVSDSGYPPENDIGQKVEDKMELISPDDAMIGERTSEEYSWAYTTNQDSLQLVELEDGSFEVVDMDNDAVLGLWSKSEDDEWIYEEYPFNKAIWFSWGGAILAGLAGIIIFIIIVRRHVTRGEFTKMIVQAIRLKAEMEEIEPYEDVPEDAEYYEAIMNAKAAELLTGFPGSKFEPDITITREEIASILAWVARYANVPVALEKTELSAYYKDFDNISEVYLNDVLFIAEFEIIPIKSDSRFIPEGLSTKKQARKIIENLLTAFSGYLTSDSGL